MSLLMLAVGFVFLIKGADWLIDGAGALAKRLNLPDLVIGLTVVAFGTSLPELVVNIVACLNETPQIAIGNVLGSNIVNIFLILGACAVLSPLVVTRQTVWREVPLSVLAAALVIVLAADRYIDRQSFSALTRIDGLVLISFFAVFISCVFSGGGREDRIQCLHKDTLGRIFAWIVFGLTGVMVGAKLVVSSAVTMARVWGLSESFIGLTIVAAGTSLPELAASVTATFKKNHDIAVGNIVGSNIFNIFFILGVSALIKPLAFTPSNLLDAFVGLTASAMLFVFMLTGKRHRLQRWKGALFVTVYGLYLIYLVNRG